MANSTATVIWQFLASKGLTPSQIAGVMGNMQQESGFSTTASGDGGSAIGICQWEGGRRTALQQMAARMGSSETDLNVQLNYLWSELTGPESGALAALRQATTASQAAQSFGSLFERFGDDSMGKRVNNAQSIFSTFSSGGTGGLATLAAGERPLSTNAGPGGGTTAADYQAALGGLSGLLTTVPELKSLLNTAIATNQPVNDFLNSVQNSEWYRSHNQATRQLVALQASDPAEYKQQLTSTQRIVQDTASKVGVPLTKPQIDSLVMQYLTQGWSPQTLAHEIGLAFKPDDSRVGLYGGVATAYTQLKDMYAQYGVPMSDSALRQRAIQISADGQTIDRFQMEARNAAKSLFPALASQIDSGMTVKQIADPYMQTMSQLLEIDPNNVTLDDPTIKKALQGTAVTSTDGKSTATTTPLWQFQNQLRQDPRWQYTDNAHQSMASLALHLGQQFGFAS